MTAHQPERKPEGPMSAKRQQRSPAAEPGARRAPEPVEASLFTPAGILHLQRSIGNAAVTRMISVQREFDKASALAGDAADVSAAIRASAGARLEPGLQAEMEARIGQPAGSFDTVRVDDGSEAMAAARALRARAFTSGDTIFGDVSSEHALVHELTHVLQQRQGPVAGTDNGFGLKVSDPSDRFEREAEANARRALSSSLAPPNPPAAPPQAAGVGTPAVQRIILIKGHQRLKGGEDEVYERLFNTGFSILQKNKSKWAKDLLKEIATQEEERGPWEVIPAKKAKIIANMHAMEAMGPPPYKFKHSGLMIKRALNYKGQPASVPVPTRGYTYYDQKKGPAALWAQHPSSGNFVWPQRPDMGESSTTTTSSSRVSDSPENDSESIDVHEVMAEVAAIIHTPTEATSSTTTTHTAISAAGATTRSKPRGKKRPREKEREGKTDIPVDTGHEIAELTKSAANDSDITIPSVEAVESTSTTSMTTPAHKSASADIASGEKPKGVTRPSDRKKRRLKRREPSPAGSEKGVSEAERIKEELEEPEEEEPAPTARAGARPMPRVGKREAESMLVRSGWKLRRRISAGVDPSQREGSDTKSPRYAERPISDIVYDPRATGVVREDSEGPDRQVVGEGEGDTGGPEVPLAKEEPGDKFIIQAGRGNFLMGGKGVEECSYPGMIKGAVDAGVARIKIAQVMCLALLSSNDDALAGYTGNARTYLAKMLGVIQFSERRRAAANPLVALAAFNRYIRGYDPDNEGDLAQTLYWYAVFVKGRGGSADSQFHRENRTNDEDLTMRLENEFLSLVDLLNDNGIYPQSKKEFLSECTKLAAYLKSVFDATYSYTVN